MTQASKQRLVLLGATGSIGRSTLDVLTRHPDRFVLHGVSAHQNVDALVALCVIHQPKHAVVADVSCYEALKQGLVAHGLPTQAHAGADALVSLAQDEETDTVLAAIVGAAGLPSTLAAAKAGKRLLLANKEAIVMAGAAFMDAVKQHQATLLPIDSEHNAVLQCAQGTSKDWRKVVLTASGGPFLGWSPDALQHITPDQACKHPKWSMGRKISVDSATLMNKGLELIEAKWLFDVQPDQLDVVIHPQSLVHALVHYHDGSCLAQLGLPDMRTAISVALAHPQRMDSGVGLLDLIAEGALTFEAPDRQAFPCLALAESAMRVGGDASIVLNAANEVAVSAFLQEQLAFTQIPQLVEAMLTACSSNTLHDVTDILACDDDVRIRSHAWVKARGRKE